MLTTAGSEAAVCVGTAMRSGVCACANDRTPIDAPSTATQRHDENQRVKLSFMPYSLKDNACAQGVEHDFCNLQQQQQSQWRQIDATHLRQHPTQGAQQRLHQLCQEVTDVGA
jgi:Asp-tRNA(Asn)/Glu-tRNA(Gln) amidotransferase A subunit family amidase